MAEELKNISLATTYEIDTSFDSERFIKLRLRVCHDGTNPNGSSFTVDDMNKAKDSIKNIPLLAHVIVDENGEPQFGSHDMHIEEDKFNDGEYRIIYDEQPIGVIPESNAYEVAEFDGRNYVFTDCYVWREYSNYAEQIIERDEKIKLSMEIIVDSFSYDGKNKVYKITDYRYKGITLLGNNIGTGMLNALATTDSFTNSKDKLLALMSELQEELIKNQFSNEKEVKKNLDEKLELIAKYGLTVEQLSFSIEELSLEELEAKLNEFDNNDSDSDTDNNNDDDNNAKDLSFSATYRQKREALSNVLDSEITRDAEGNIVDEIYYWIEDFNDTYVYVQRSHWSANGDYESNYGRFSYSFDEKNLTATLTSEFEEMFIMWLTKEEKDALEAERGDYAQLKSDFEAYKEKYPEDEFKSLRKFKSDKIEAERKEAEEEIFSEFDKKLSGNEEYETLKTNSKEYDLDELQEKCFTILGKTQINFSFNAKKQNTIKINIDSTPTSSDPYGGLIEKVIQKQN
jgi:hypothetical protein